MIPRPVLLHFSLSTNTFWREINWVKELESNWELIRDEYLNLERLKLESDYEISASEQKVNWFSLSGDLQIGFWSFMKEDGTGLAIFWKGQNKNGFKSITS